MDGCREEDFETIQIYKKKYLQDLLLETTNKLMRHSERYRKASKFEKLKILGYAHNQGAGAPGVNRGAIHWLKTGEIGKDAFGTKGTKYYDALDVALKDQSKREYVSSTPRADIPNIAARNNKKFFGNIGGEVSWWGKWKSTAGATRYTSRLARILGHIPYTGSTAGRGNATLHPGWVAENIVSLSSPLSYISGTEASTIRVNKTYSQSSFGSYSRVTI